MTQNESPLAGIELGLRFIQRRLTLRRLLASGFQFDPGIPQFFSFVI